MTNSDRSKLTPLDVIKPWIAGRQVSIYLRGREKPITGLTVCQVLPQLIVARWNSSTHLVPLNAIAFIRFAPDSDPCRNIKHPLHTAVSHKGTTSRRAPAQRTGSPGQTRDAATIGDVVSHLRFTERD